MARQEIHEMCGHTNRSHARTSSSVRNTKCLVQVQVTHIGPERSRRGQTHLSIHVRSIHVDLATGLMDPLTYILHRHLKHTMSAGVGNHQSGQFAPMLIDLLPEISDIDIALEIARHRNHRHSGHHR